MKVKILIKRNKNNLMTYKREGGENKNNFVKKSKIIK